MADDKTAAERAAEEQFPWDETPSQRQDGLREGFVAGAAWAADRVTVAPTREAMVDFMDDWYDRFAGPGEEWAFSDLADAVLAVLVPAEQHDNLVRADEGAESVKRPRTKEQFDAEEGNRND